MSQCIRAFDEWATPPNNTKGRFSATHIIYRISVKHAACCGNYKTVYRSSLACLGPEIFMTEVENSNEPKNIYCKVVMIF